jgi:hypothetical protein
MRHEEDAFVIDIGKREFAGGIHAYAGWTHF